MDRESELFNNSDTPKSDWITALWDIIDYTLFDLGLSASIKKTFAEYDNSPKGLILVAMFRAIGDMGWEMAINETTAAERKIIAALEFKIADKSG